MHTWKFAVTMVVGLSLSGLSAGQAAPRDEAVSKAAVMPHVRLGLGAHWRSRAAAAAVATRKAVPDAVALGLASAKVYRFASADFPGASTSLVFDMNPGTILGDCSFGGAFQTFTQKGTNYQSLSVPNSLANEATGINTSGQIVGVYEDFTTVTHGFLDTAGVFTSLDSLAGTSVVPLDINDSGEIVGTYVDTASVSHGFSTLDHGASYTLFDFPGATSTLAAGVNTAGTITGEWTDSASVRHGFLYSGGVFTNLDFPLATGTTAIGINDSNEIAGVYSDATSTSHGFLYSDGAYTKVDVAGASETQLTRIKNKGQITGEYIDSAMGEHGLVGR